MAGYKASKTQVKKLDELGIAHESGISYPEAAALLKAAGWSECGREQEIRIDSERDALDYR